MHEPSRWAVVVGIDYYSSIEPGSSLRGAVNDAVLMYELLRDLLKIPESNIRLHLARNPGFLPTTSDPASTSPTITNFLQSVDHIIEHARPGDLIHIHFSGHGVRELTLHSDKKSATALDELLCFVDGDLDDVEFGQKLDYMASPPNSLIVLITLDCCFSGGATRARYSGVRCKPQGLLDTRGVDEVADNSNTAPDIRNANLQKGWLYRNRDYNVMAACQPFETAGEMPDATGKMYGIFTSTMVSCLRELGNRRYFTTYGEFQGVLDATVKGMIKSKGTGVIKLQQPMILGPRGRVIFDSISLDTTHSFAHVIGVSQDAITIDRGYASGARLSNIYRLWNPRKARTLAEQGSIIDVILVSIGEYESDAKICKDPENVAPVDLQQSVKIGWLAEIIQRTGVIYARVIDEGTDAPTELVKEIQDTWESFRNPVMPIDLDFLGSAENISRTNFHVHVRRSAVDILYPDGKPFDHLPNIQAESPNLARWLMQILEHLQSFLFISDIKTTAKLQESSKIYKASIIETNQLDDGDTVSSWLINVDNLSKSSLFVIVLNLTPLHGIKQLVPHELGYGHPVEPGDKMEVVIDIHVPEILAKQYHCSTSFSMKDILKIFITTKPIDLHHFQLEDMKDLLPEPRHAKVRVPTIKSSISWYVEEKEIITTSYTKRTTVRGFDIDN